MKKYLGVGLLVFLLSVVGLFCSFSYAIQILPQNNIACFPGCFVNITIIPNETLDYVNISFSGASVLSLTMLSDETNGTYIPFVNNYYNFSENKTYSFITEISNPAKANLSVTMNVLSYAKQFNATDSININYYRQKAINISATLVDFDIRQNGASILSSFNLNSGKIDVVLSGNIYDYASNNTFYTIVTIKNINSSLLDFSQYISILDNDPTIYAAAKELDTLPRFIILISNIDAFLSTNPKSYESITINENGLELLAYYYYPISKDLVMLENRVSEEPIIVQTASTIYAYTNTSLPIVINDYSKGPVIDYMNISNTKIHTGQTITFTLYINDTDIKYASINDERLNNITRNLWTKDIIITQTPATLYIIDKRGHSIYLENITFDIDDIAPILYMYEPKDITYLNEYLNLIWSSEDPALNSTFFYIDNGQYNGNSGYYISGNKYIYNISESGTLQINNLITGLHKINLFSNDNYSNVRERETYFRVNTLLNNTRFTKDVLGFDYKDYLKYINTTCPYYDNATNSTYNISCNYTYLDYRKYKGITRIENWNISFIGESVAADKNIDINIVLNETKYNTSQPSKYIVDVNFYGLDATWKRYFIINKSKENLISNFRNKTNATIEDIIFFDNIDSFFLNEQLCNINITFPYPFLDYDVLYYDNTLSTLPNKFNVSKIVKYSDKFVIPTKCTYGIVIIKNKPQIRLSVEETLLRIYNNMFNLTGNVYSVSTNISCRYELKNFLYLNPFKKFGNIELSNDIEHSFVVSFSGIPDEYYKLNISCTEDISKNIKEIIQYFFVEDTTPPVITSIRNVGPDTVSPYSIEDKTSLTLDIPTMTLFTDENATCALSENDVNFYNMTVFDETGSTKHTTKLYLNKQTFLLFIRCIDTKKNEMVQPKILHYYIKDKYIPPASSIPSVGYGTVFNPIEGSGKETRTWQKIDENSIINVNFAEESNSFELIKMTTNAELNNISFSANISLEKFGYNISPLYASIKLTQNNFENKDLSYRIIYFRVLNSWFDEKGTKPENIILVELNDQKKIVQANTYKLRTSSDYTYFQAEPEYLDTYFITVWEEGDTTSLLYQNQNGVNGQEKGNIIKPKNETSFFEGQNIIVKHRSYILVTILIVIFSLLISIIFASHQMNQTPKHDITKLYRSKKIISELNKEILGKINEKKGELKKDDESKTFEQDNQNQNL